MDSFFKLEVQYSTSHLFFPKIVIGILVVLAVIMAVKYALARARGKQPLVSRNWSFFVKDADFFMLFGSLGLFILYILALKPLGFLVSSLIFIFLFNLLFCRTFKLKSVFISLIISVISCVLVWYLFSVVFNISLP
ncbi:MAG: tripartite tricarboxylate transporter TctB family protein [Spirochaetales bacterium]|jgi:hypothetical protein|nr:tripartite tricarboxylate transporter TctB family protein [Spirochaetales bacterium]